MRRSGRDTFGLMNRDDSSRDLACTNWVAAVMAGRGHDARPSVVGEDEPGEVAFALAAVVVEFVVTYAAFG